MKRYRPAANPHLVRASGDRWLFGYADIVTLLLACFVCMYAATLGPPSEAKAAESAHVTPVKDAETTPVAPPPAIAPGPMTTTSALEDDLRRLLGTGQTLDVEVSSSDHGLVVSVPEAGSFPPGQADLSPAARLVMTGLAGELRDRANLVRIEGHTDDVPIRTARFGSNWELSTARATTVVQFFIEEGGLSPDRLSAAGYAEYRPKVLNDSPPSRARNRRVDIVILQPDASGLERGLAGVLGIRP